jgi:hypothetical protein
MSSDLAALMSATFHEAGHAHLVELVHQRDRAARRRLHALRVDAYDAGGDRRREIEVDPREEILDLAAWLDEPARRHGRLLVTFDARYDPQIFPYRPHHYAYLHRPDSAAPPLYYAINATLGGVPDRIGAVALNNFESYLFLDRPTGGQYAIAVGNLSRFATADAEVVTYYDRVRHVEDVRLAPKAHAEVALAPERDGQRLRRVELKALFRLTSYVVGRRAGGELVLFDHLFTYFTT